jgi:hypothetical protein
MVLCAEREVRQRPALLKTIWPGVPTFPCRIGGHHLEGVGVSEHVGTRMYHGLAFTVGVCPASWLPMVEIFKSVVCKLISRPVRYRP